MDRKAGYRSVRFTLLKIRPNSFIIRGHGQDRSEKVLPRSLISGPDDFRFGELRDDVLPIEVQARVFAWKAESLGL